MFVILFVLVLEGFVFVSSCCVSSVWDHSLVRPDGDAMFDGSVDCALGMDCVFRQFVVAATECHICVFRSDGMGRDEIRSGLNCGFRYVKGKVFPLLASVDGFPKEWFLKRSSEFVKDVSVWLIRKRNGGEPNVHLSCLFMTR